MDNILNRIKTFAVDYFTLTAQLVPQADAEKAIRDDVTFRGTNILILVLAILIASLGLNTNSTAVIIGAMLISPLMGPIIGLGLGVGIHDFELLKRCIRNLVIAAGFSVLASTLYFLISPVSEGHSELLARTSPTIYDVLIGFFGGGAGIIAIGSRHKGNVIPGVAIATALMPPLCTAGYGLATWQLNYFFGAFYLFLINSIYIAFATFIGVKLLGYQGQSVVNDVRARRVRRVVYILAILTMLPSVYLTYTMLRQNNFSREAQRFVNRECVFPATQVLSDKATIDGNQRQITITLIGQPLPVDSLELALSSRLQYYGLQGTRLTFIQGGNMSSPTSQSENVRDIYQLTQATISRQQQTIDSLRSIVDDMRNRQDAGVKIAPEIRVLFPQVSDIAINTSIFSSVAGHKADTVNVALVHFSEPLPAPQLIKFREYLCARLGLTDIEIVNSPANADKKHPSASGK